MWDRQQVYSKAGIAQELPGQMIKRLTDFARQRSILIKLAGYLLNVDDIGPSIAVLIMGRGVAG